MEESFVMSNSAAYEDKYILFLGKLAKDETINLKSLATMAPNKLMEKMGASEFDRTLAAKEVALSQEDDQCSSLAMRLIVMLSVQAQLTWKHYEEIRALYNNMVHQINNFRKTINNRFYDSFVDYFRSVGYDSSKAHNAAKDQMDMLDTRYKIRDLMDKMMAELDTSQLEGKPLELNSEYWCEEWKEEETGYYFDSICNKNTDFLNIADVLHKKGALTLKEELAVTYTEAILRRDGILDKTLKQAHGMVVDTTVEEPTVDMHILQERRALAQLADSFIASAEAGVLVTKSGQVMRAHDHALCPYLLGMRNVKKVIMISYGSAAVVLRSDGTVRVEYKPGTKPMKSLEKAVSHWTGVVDIVKAVEDIVALTKDGRVVYTDGSCKIWDSARTWRNVKQIDASQRFLVALMDDGTVDFASVDCAHLPTNYSCPDVSEWENIVAVSCADINVKIGNHSDTYGFWLGLTEDGNVLFAGDVAPGREREYRELLQVRNAVSIDANELGVVIVDAHGNSRIIGYSDVKASYTSHTQFDDWSDSEDVMDDEDEEFVPVIAARGCTKLLENGNISGTDIYLFSDIEELKQMEADRIAQETIAKQMAARRQQNLCQHCGGKFKGLFKKACKDCGKAKDY